MRRHEHSRCDALVRIWTKTVCFELTQRVLWITTTERGRVFG
jgi:hypothetical protein